MTPDDPRHGKYAGAVAHWGAGEEACPSCRRAALRYKKGRELEALQTGQSRRVPAWRVTRRIEALQALGYTMQDIADAAGMSFRSVWNIGRRGPTIYRARFDLIADAYERLSAHPAPEGPYATRTRNRARRRGWAPPLAWDDIDNPDEKPTGHRTCKRDDCVREVWAKGLCSTHYGHVYHHPTVPDTHVDEAAVIRALNGDFAAATGPVLRAEVVRRWAEKGRALNDLERLSGWKVDRYRPKEAA